MTQRTSLSLTNEMHNAIKKVADERGVSQAYVIREAVAAYLERSKIRIGNVHPDWGGWRGFDEEAEVG